MTAYFNKDLPGCKCQTDSRIQKTSERAESRRSKTSKSRES